LQYQSAKHFKYFVSSETVTRGYTLTSDSSHYIPTLDAAMWRWYSNYIMWRKL